MVKIADNNQLVSGGCGWRLETSNTIRYEVESFRALPSVNDENSKDAVIV